jgi:hypothetical protein
MTKTSKTFAAFLITGSAVMFFMNIYTLATWEPIDLKLSDVVKLP